MEKMEALLKRVRMLLELDHPFSACSGTASVGA